MPSTPRPQIVVYPNAHEYKELERKAEKIGLSLSKYLIFCGMNAEIKVEIKEKEYHLGQFGRD